MLRSLKDLERYEVSATDGVLGRVVDFLLDDAHWTVRYLVLDTDGFFAGRQVLISPISFREIDWSDRRFHVALTKDKVRNSPGIDLAKPVSRQHELRYNDYYGYPYYWGYSGLWGPGTFPGALAAGRASDRRSTVAVSSVGDTHLRSANEVCGYHVEGTDGGIGHVCDFIVDDTTWRLPYLVIDTSNWWVGQKVLVAPQWTTRVSWADRKVHLDMSRDLIKRSPRWVPGAPVNREYEERLYDFYGRPVYWAGSPRRLTPEPSSSPRHP
jgi:hypothetical protein